MLLSCSRPFALTGIALLSSTTVHSKEKKKEEELLFDYLRQQQ